MKYADWNFIKQNPLQNPSQTLQGLLEWMKVYGKLQCVKKLLSPVENTRSGDFKQSYHA